MIGNFHTHSTFCDGKNTPEEIVLGALEQGLHAIGFSSHGYTQFDLRYCMKDTEGYLFEIRRLQEKYKKDIEIYVGIEEDAHHPCDRSRFDYIIGSSHYSYRDGSYHAVDSSHDYFKVCLAAWQNDTLAFANEYYSFFCDYIESRRPDIVGHFDLVTKFDELEGEDRFLSDPAYCKLARTYLEKIANIGPIFELNTGAISRGMRTTPYPSLELLHVIRKAGGRMILSSDSHEVKTLRFGFEEGKALLKEAGFPEVYTLYRGKFVSVRI